MVEILIGYSNANLDNDDFIKSIHAFSQVGYYPIFLRNKEHLIKALGLENISHELRKKITNYRIKQDIYYYYRTEIFIIDNDVYFIINMPSYEGILRRPSVEIGIITKNAFNMKEKLGKFIKDFNEAIKKGVDGRKTRHMKLKWMFKSDRDRVDTFVSFYKTFKNPDFNLELLQAANELAFENTRRFLIDISQAGMIREHELISKNKNRNDLEKQLNKLVTTKLLKEEYLVICKRTSNPLTKLESLQHFSDNSIANLVCGACNNLYKNELIQKVFSLTDLAKKSLSHNHWMTIWLTDVLVRKGVPKEGIVWNVEESGEEIDCLVQFKDEVWVFELKDRTFEAGDAYPFNYRRVKFKADKAIIVTTKQISKQAKMVFKDLFRETISQKKQFFPIYIEGLERVEYKLDILIKNTFLKTVLHKAEEISALENVNIVPVFEEKFGKLTIIDDYFSYKDE